MLLVVFQDVDGLLFVARNLLHKGLTAGEFALPAKVETEAHGELSTIDIAIEIHDMNLNSALAIFDHRGAAAYVDYGPIVSPLHRGIAGPHTIGHIGQRVDGGEVGRREAQTVT